MTIATVAEDDAGGSQTGQRSRRAQRYREAVQFFRAQAFDFLWGEGRGAQDLREYWQSVAQTRRQRRQTDIGAVPTRRRRKRAAQGFNGFGDLRRGVRFRPAGQQRRGKIREARCDVRVEYAARLDPRRDADQARSGTRDNHDADAVRQFLLYRRREG